MQSPLKIPIAGYRTHEPFVSDHNQFYGSLFCIASRLNELSFGNPGGFFLPISGSKSKGCKLKIIFHGLFLASVTRLGKILPFWWKKYHLGRIFLEDFILLLGQFWGPFLFTWANFFPKFIQYWANFGAKFYLPWAKKIRTTLSHCFAPRFNFLLGSALVFYVDMKAAFTAGVSIWRNLVGPFCRWHKKMLNVKQI